MWSEGTIQGYKYWVKHYETGSQYSIGACEENGYDGGKISKLSIRKGNEEMYNYDRGLDYDNLDEAGKAVYAQILEKYN